VTFLLSGILHACGSHNLAGSTRPWTAFVPFALQPFGTFIEAAAGRYLSLACPEVANSRSWRAKGHFGFTLSWLVLTFPFGRRFGEKWNLVHRAFAFQFIEMDGH
jgi:hypothetical protein